jgi:phosphonate transport system permease protein
MSQTISEEKNLIPHHSLEELNLKNTITGILIDAALWSYAILVCKKVIYEKIILALRYPEFNWNTPLYALIAGTIIGALVHMAIPTLSVGRAIKKTYCFPDHVSFIKRPFGLFLTVIIAITFVSGLIISQVSMKDFLSESGLSGARRIFGALINPNWAIFEEALFAAIETIYMAFIATAFAIPVAFTLSFFAARNLMSGSKFTLSVYSLIRFFLNLSRSIEPLVWAIIFSVWVGIGPFSGMLALCVHSVASLSKLYSEQIENISDGPIEAITATGAHPIQVIWFGVVPQVVLPFLSFTIYRWDINVRMATVIGLVGGGGIGTMLMQFQGLAKWNEVGLIVVVIAAIVWAMDYLSSRIRNTIK